MQFYILRAEALAGPAVRETSHMRVEAGPYLGLKQAYTALSQGWQPQVSKAKKACRIPHHTSTLSVLQAAEHTECIFLDINTPVFISPHPVEDRCCMLVAAPFVEAARQGRYVHIFHLIT